MERFSEDMKAKLQADLERIMQLRDEAAQHRARKVQALRPPSAAPAATRAEAGPGRGRRRGRSTHAGTASERGQGRR